MMSNVITSCPNDVRLFLVGMFVYEPGRYAEWMPLLGAVMPKQLLSFLLHRAGICGPQAHTVTYIP